MSNDDPTKNLPGNPVDNKTTQPSITAVFRLLQDIDTRFSGRFEEMGARLERLETRFDQLELRIARDFAAVDARFVEMSNEMKSSFIQLGDKLADQMDHLRLHTEADYQDLLRRMRRLESQAS